MPPRNQKKSRSKTSLKNPHWILPQDSPPTGYSTRRGRRQVLVTAEELRLNAWTWSFSRFKVFLECAQKYKEEYVYQDKIPPLSQKPFFQGSVAHKTAEETRERLMRGEVESMEAAHGAFDGVFTRYAEKIVWKDDTEIMKAIAEGREILTNYLGLLRAVKLDVGEVYCEYVFGTPDKPLIRPSGLRLIGSIDWLQIDRERMTARVFDAKTSQGTRYLDRRQLILYAMVVEQIFGVTVEETGYLMLRWDKPLLKSVTRQDMADLEAEMVQAATRVEAGEFKAALSMSLCGPCQYSYRCTQHKTWILNGGASSEVEW
jgi:hypothetical protein